MRLKNLKVEQFRGFQQATEIEFHDRFTLIAGENGVGKSSILWAIRVLLSHFIHPGLMRAPDKLSFRVDDITRGWPYLRAEAVIHSVPERVATKCVVQKNVSKFVMTTTDDTPPRKSRLKTPDIYQLSFQAFGPPHKTPSADVAALAVYYSAHRSVARQLGLRQGRAAGGIVAAHADALKDRELRLGEQAYLWHKEAVLEKTDQTPAYANRAIEQVMPAFLGAFKNLRTEIFRGKPKLVVDKRGKQLELNQLSDGERGLLAILLDLTRRLSQANQNLKNPASDGYAVVLIDEIELHLHPKWQRTIINNLTKAFPKVQFIATTHSPQILGEIPASQILMLESDAPPIRPAQAFGMDSNWILQVLMEADEQDFGVKAEIESIFRSIQNKELDLAADKVQSMRRRIGNSEILQRAASSIERIRMINK